MLSHIMGRHNVEIMIASYWILLLLNLQSFDADPRQNSIQTLVSRLNSFSNEIVEIQKSLAELARSFDDADEVERKVDLSKIKDLDNNDQCFARTGISLRSGLGEEKKWARNQFQELQTKIAELASNMEHLKNDLTAVRAGSELVAAEINVTLVKLGDAVSDLSDLLKRQSSHYDAQIDRLNTLSVQQMATSVQLQSTINEVIGSKDRELKLIRDYVKNIEMWFSNLHTYCPSGWKNFMGYCYYLHPTTTTFNEARESCKLIDSELVDVRSSTENDFVGSHGQRVWLGISNANLDGNWTVIRTGNPILFSNWDDGQPEGKEDCAVLYTTENFPWHDYMCTRSFGFVCRKPA